MPIVNNETNKEGSTASTELNSSGHFRQSANWRKYLGSAATWTAIFTAALVFFTGKLWQVSDRQNEITVSSQRGFLTFAGPTVGVRLVDNLGAWKGNEIALIWNNAGNTAARNVVIENNAETFFPDIPESFSFPLVPSKTKAVIGPKGNYGVNITMPKETVSENWRQNKRIFVWGTAVYNDSFANTPDRVTEFCVELTHLTVNQQPGIVSPVQTDLSKPETNLTGFQWQQCAEHNCYDGDCKDYSAAVKKMRE